MMATLFSLITMGDYGTYVWSAYGIVFVFLGLQWFFSWRRFKLHRKNIYPDE